MDGTIQPNTYIALRLPSDALKVLEIKPNEYVGRVSIFPAHFFETLLSAARSTISIGKYGTFQTDHLIGQPYYHTYEILDRADAEPKTALRVVRAAELYAPIKAASSRPDGSDPSAAGTPEDGVEYEVLSPDGQIVMRTNQHTVDDTSRQKLSMAEIEALKRADVDGGRDVVAQILANHSAIDQKTDFALAKYTLRKTKKYFKRFTVLPVDVPLLANWIVNEKDATRIMEMREEALALVCSWANVHCGGLERDAETGEVVDENRWLVVDGTGGLVIAAMAERMGILYPSATPPSEQKPEPASRPDPRPNQDTSSTPAPKTEESTDRPSTPPPTSAPAPTSPSTPRRIPKNILAQESHMSARTNTLTLIHANAQPNLWLLNYFGYDPNAPSLTHPLHTHLHTLTWLQLLDPASDATYQEPATVSPETLASYKSTKRGNYYRKRRRWARVRGVVDAARKGGFKGLVVACPGLDASSVLRHTLPLLRGGAQVVVYDPHVEPLARLADLYSKARRSAYMAAEAACVDAVAAALDAAAVAAPDAMEAAEARIEEAASTRPKVPSAEYPVDPRLVLAPTIYTARAKQWQVLPGRTHPRMTARGGAEGYVWVGTRVFPVEGKVEARGFNRGSKKRKTEPAVVEGREPLDAAEQEGMVVKGEDDLGMRIGKVKGKGEPRLEHEGSQAPEAATGDHVEIDIKKESS